MDEIIIYTGAASALSTEGALEELRDEARDFAAQARAANTLRAYASDWADFKGWCESHGRAPLPASPETVCLYLTALARSRRPATLQRRLAAISILHQAAALPSPTKDLRVKDTMRGIRRQLGSRQKGAAPVTIELLRRMMEAAGG